MPENINYEDCPDLFDSRANARLDSIKYHSFICKIDYLNFLYGSGTFSASLAAAERFRDLAGAKFVLNKFDKTYPKDLYSDIDTIERNFARAVNFFDIEEIKIMSFALGYESHLHIYDLVKLNSKQKKIFFAIDLCDLEGVKNLMSGDDLTGNELINIVKHAYYKERLDIAEYFILYIIQKGKLNDIELVKTVFSGILRSNPVMNYEIYEKHISSFSNIKNSDFTSIALKSLVNSIFATKKFFLLNSAVYSDRGFNDAELEFDIFVGRKQHFTSNDVISFLGINGANNKEAIELFFPIDSSNFVQPFYSPFTIYDPFKNHRIYVPFNWNNFLSTLIHEASHALFYILLANNGLPYVESRGEMIKDYDIAVNNTLTNVFLNFTNNKYDSFQNLNLMRLLWLNYWHEYSHEDDIMVHTLFKKIFKESTSFTKNEKSLILEEKYQEIVIEFGWSNDHKFVLERILDYYLQNVKDQEFIVRLTECYTAGISDAVMIHFQPIIKYWEQYISPILHSIRFNHFNECKEQLIEQGTINNCVLYALASKQAHEIWLSSVEQKCPKCFEHIYSDPYLKESIPLQQKKEIVSFAASKISYCVEYCFDWQNCVVLPPYQCFGTILQPVVKSLFGCTKIYGNSSDNSEWAKIIETILQHENSIFQPEEKVLCAGEFNVDVEL